MIYDVIWYDIIRYDIYLLTCNWVATRWQLYNTHLHTNNTQNDKEQHQNFWKSAGRAPSLRVLPWQLPYNWGKRWTVRGWNLFRSGIFLARPDRSWGPPSLLYNGYCVFTEGKAAEAWIWPPTISSSDVKERVEVYFYSPYWPSWPVLGWPLSYHLPCIIRAKM